MCKLTYNVSRNEDIADVTDANYRNWLLGKVKIHLEGIQDDGTTVEFDLWQFRTTGNDKKPENFVAPTKVESCKIYKSN